MFYVYGCFLLLFSLPLRRALDRIGTTQRGGCVSSRLRVYPHRPPRTTTALPHRTLPTYTFPCARYARPLLSLAHVTHFGHRFQRFTTRPPHAVHTNIPVLVSPHLPGFRRFILPYKQRCAGVYFLPVSVDCAHYTNSAHPAPRAFCARFSRTRALTFERAAANRFFGHAVGSPC